MKTIITYLLLILGLPSALSAQQANTQKVMYFSQVTGVNDLNGVQGTYNGYLDNDNRLFVSGFEEGKGYTLLLYNIIGNKVFSEDFSATGNSQRFDIDRQLTPGIYMVRIVFRNEPSSNIVVIKVVKSS